jgi:hypothetical protein
VAISPGSRFGRWWGMSGDNAPNCQSIGKNQCSPLAAPSPVGAGSDRRRDPSASRLRFSEEFWQRRAPLRDIPTDRSRIGPTSSRSSGGFRTWPKRSVTVPLRACNAASVTVPLRTGKAASGPFGPGCPRWRTGSWLAISSRTTDGPGSCPPSTHPHWSRHTPGPDRISGMLHGRRGADGPAGCRTSGGPRADPSTSPS